MYFAGIGDLLITRREGRRIVTGKCKSGRYKPLITVVGKINSLSKEDNDRLLYDIQFEIYAHVIKTILNLYHVASRDVAG